MSGILHRLQRTLKGRKEGYDETSSSIAAELQSNSALLSRLNGEGQESLEFSSLEGARETQTPYGACLELVTRYPLNHLHGSVSLDQAYAANCSLLESLVGDERLLGFNPEDALFLDIEATGLDHGAGTFAFMIGLGYLENDSFIVKQLFLPDMHEEQPMLHVLKEHLDRFRFLISFNGKSYDLTVLQSRMVIQRVYTSEECNLKLQPHLDLLHLARNLYRKCFENTRLPTLETSLLDFHRVDDVPSALVPTMWFEFLRTRNAHPIQLVAEHNLYDVLSMVALTGVIARHSHLSKLRAAESDQVAVNLGRVWLRRKHTDRAITALEAAMDTSLDTNEISEKYRGLGKAYGRTKNYLRQGEVLARWCELCPHEVDAWTAHAIYQERRGNDLRGALDSAYRVRTLAPSQPNRRRIDRLQRRIERSS